MTDQLASLIAAAVAFVGSHFALSHPLRAPLVARLGAQGFMVLYSVVALVTLGWTIWAFRQVPPYGVMAWTGNDDVSWAIASALTLVALVLFLGSLRGNPALPGTVALGLSDKQPAGVFRVTRHPMMWGFALWALAHAIVAPTSRTLVLTIAVAFLALLGAHLQDRKKAALTGAEWTEWSAKTHYWPRWRNLFSAGLLLWVVSIALWLALTWAHIRLAYVPAGVWRWLG